MRLAVFLLLGTLLFAGEEGLKLSPEQMKVLGIKVAPAEERKVPVKVKVPAEVQADPTLTYEVHSPVEGIVKKLYVKEGDEVRKGAPLAEVYSEKVAQLIAQLKQARADYETAKRRYEKYKKLYAQRVIKFIEVFNAELELQRARQTYGSLSELLRSVGEVKGYNLLLRSPVGGVVARQGVVPGRAVSTEDQLFTVRSYERVWVYGFAPSREASLLKEGSKGTVLKGGKEVPCRLTFVAKELDPETRRLKVRCEAKNEEGLLKPYEFVDLLLFAGEVKGVLVPEEALQELKGKKVVFVYENGAFFPKEVKVLGKADGYYRVEGIKPGELVAVKGTFFLKSKYEGVEGGH